MPENCTLLFTSFWFSIFFLLMSISNSIICFECIEYFDVFLITLLCILCSYELSKNLTLKLIKIDEDNKK